MSRESYFSVLTQAIADLTEHGFDSIDRVARWQQRLRESAEATLPSEEAMTRSLKDALTSVYQRLVISGGVARYHPGVNRFTIDQLAPRLRLELQRRIMISADLIKLNRSEAISKTLHRFSGWASSLPTGGSDLVKKVKTKDDIRKSLVKQTFEVRRVQIDQGHKLIDSINDIIASDGGAIAARWHSQWRRPGYQYRHSHKERDDEIYLIKGSWAYNAGLIKPGKAGFTSDVTRPGEEPFCSCYYEYVYNVRDLPADMRTKKGEEELAKARKALANA